MAKELNLSGAKETREQAGMRIATERMPRVQKQLRLLGNIGKYPIGEARIEKLCQMLDKWVTETKVLLRNHHKGAEETFKF